MNHPIHCGNCQWTGDLDGDDYVVLDEVPDLNTRISPGCECPAGACPACGCLLFLGELPELKEMSVASAIELLKMKLQTDDNDAWDAMDKISQVFSGAQKKFRCPHCGGSHFGSSGLGDNMIGICHSCRRDKFSWPRTDDDKYFRWEISMPVSELREQRRDVSTGPGKRKCLAVYSHRHGIDVLSFTTAKDLGDLDPDEVAKKLEVDWEPEREEYMDFLAAGDLRFPDID